MFGDLPSNNASGMKLWDSFFSKGLLFFSYLIVVRMQAH